MRLSNRHIKLTNGVGKCSKPMWQYGLPAGFCDKDAYGEQKHTSHIHAGLVPALACPDHGGPGDVQKPKDE